MVIDQFNIGGTETHVFALARALQKQGIEVVIAGKYGRMLSRFAGAGLPCYEIDFVLDNHEVDDINHTRYTEIIASIIERESIDLIHGHQFPSGYPAFQAASRKRIPFVFTVHGNYYDEVFLRRIHDHGVLISVSPAIQRALKAKGIDSDLVANGIDANDYRSYRDTDSPYRSYIRSRLQLPEETKLIVYASRLSWEKADICEEMIHAITALRIDGHTDVHLLIIGDGRKGESIRQLARAHNELLGSTYIHSLGEVDHIHTYYAASDVVIGTGRVALEAMASRRLIIAAGSRGYGGIIRPDNHMAAWHTWFGDHDAERHLTRKGLIRDLKEVILMSGNRLTELARANLRHVQTTYPIARICQETLRVYESLMRRVSLPVRVRAASKMNNRT